MKLRVAWKACRKHADTKDTFMTKGSVWPPAGWPQHIQRPTDSIPQSSPGVRQPAGPQHLQRPRSYPPPPAAAGVQPGINHKQAGTCGVDNGHAELDLFLATLSSGPVTAMGM